MDNHIRQFYSQYSDKTNKGNFHRVVAVHKAVDIDWQTISRCVPTLPRGWFELSQLPVEDRIQFSLDHWLLKFPYHPNIDTALSTFFGQLDDIGVYLTQRKYDDPFVAEMVYSLKGNRGFYRGAIPASEDDKIELQKLFPDYILPEDYLAFLKIHNGFCKTTDCTGIISTKEMSRCYDELQEILKSQPEQVVTKSGKVINPNALIPFYESFGMPFYQCFWGEWYPEQEMGNVYYSGSENTISEPLSDSSGSAEDMAFPTFVDWLLFYLEQFET